SVFRFSLGQAERDQSWLIDRCGDSQPVAALILGQRGARLRTDQSVDHTMVVTLSAQCHLHILGHLAGGVVVISVDWAVIEIGRIIRTVAVGRIPVAIPRVIIPTAEEDKACIRKARHPPGPRMPYPNDMAVRDGKAVAIDRSSPLRLISMTLVFGLTLGGVGQRQGQSES